MGPSLWMGPWCDVSSSGCLLKFLQKYLIWKYTISPKDKYTWHFWQIKLAVWTNTYSKLDTLVRLDECGTIWAYEWGLGVMYHPRAAFYRGRIMLSLLKFWIFKPQQEPLLQRTQCYALLCFITFLGLEVKCMFLEHLNQNIYVSLPKMSWRKMLIIYHDEKLAILNFLKLWFNDKSVFLCSFTPHVAHIGLKYDLWRGRIHGQMF